MVSMKMTQEKSERTAYPPYFDTIEHLRDEWEEASAVPEIEEAPGVFWTIKDPIKGHREQTVFPDDCGFGDNDLCYVES